MEEVTEDGLERELGLAVEPEDVTELLHRIRSFIQRRVIFFSGRSSSYILMTFLL